MFRFPRKPVSAGTLLVAGLLAVSGLVSGNAVAQDEPDGARVEQAIQQTDQVLERAAGVVSESDNEQAAILLRSAVEFQNQAKEAFSNGRLLIAYRLTQQASGYAMRAVSVANGSDGPDADRVGAAIERTDQVIERVSEKVAESDSERARAQLRAAIELQSRAKAQYAEENLGPALRFTRAAREHALKAARLAHGTDHTGDRVEKALEYTDALIERGTPKILDSGNDRAVSLLEAAVRLQSAAKKQFEEGNKKMAARLTHQAREKLHLALRIASGSSKSDPSPDVGDLG